MKNGHFYDTYIWKCQKEYRLIRGTKNFERFSEEKSL